jgi:hypothetical protein
MIVVVWEPIIPRMVAIGPVERASRSSRVTISTSPAPRLAIALRSCDRLVLAPLATSRNTFPAPAAFSAATCAARRDRTFGSRPAQPNGRLSSLVQLRTDEHERIRSAGVL